ncbi:hypothetical protein [uncultured Nocardioides sp.]|uniref:hypothetical protein n=1 Tax=uncultured Nocardioides sp. TaxID=198441 RepID=UPI000C572E11|nr:hypothetical protein [Nocardioides sp.]
MAQRPTDRSTGRSTGRPTGRSSRASTSRPRRLAGSGPRPGQDVHRPEAEATDGSREVEQSGDPLVPPPPPMPGDPEVHDQHEDREEQAAPADEQTTVAWRGLGRRGLLALVAVIVLLTAAVVVEAVVLWRDNDRAGVTAERPVVVPERTWRPAVEAAAQGAQIVLGASWETYDEGIERARGVMTDEFAETYLATKEDVREDFVDQRTEVEVRVLGQAVTRATGSTVQALLFLNQYVTKKGAQTSFSEYRALVTVVDTPDGWLIDQIDTQ